MESKNWQVLVNETNNSEKNNAQKNDDYEGDLEEENYMYNHAGIITNENVIYTFGGINNNNKSTNSVYRLDLNIEKKQWMKVNVFSDYLEFRTRHTAVYHKNKVIIFGGMLNSKQENNSLVYYDIEKNQFSLIHPTLLETTNDLKNIDGSMFFI